MAFCCFCGLTTSAFSQTFIFSDDPLTAGVTLVKAVHITELRDDSNVLRLRQGLLSVTFTDPVGPGLGPIRAIHIGELRTALDDVFDSLGRSRPVYTDAPQPAAEVTLIKLDHIAELRNAVRAAGLLILTASQTGTGSGTVTSNPVGIDCGSDCTEPYLPGTTVTLTASPAAGSVFAGWGGSCTGTGSCQVTLTTADRSVTATFTTVPALTDLTTSLFAGQPGVSGSSDGPSATFGNPAELATDGTYLWVGHDTVIRRVSLATATVATVAGQAGTPGYVNEPIGTSARFGSISSLAVCGGVVWIGDGVNHRLRAMSTVGSFAVTTMAGSGAGITNPANHLDGVGTAATIGDPRGLTCHGAFVYFLEPAASTLRRFNPATGEVTTLAGSPFQTGTVAGFGAAARFVSPRHMTASSGMLYVSDTNGASIRSLDIASNFAGILWGTGTPGYADGVGGAVLVHRPRGIATDGTSVYWAEFDMHTIRQGILATSAVGTVAGTVQPLPCPVGGCPGGYQEGTGPDAAFSGPWSLVYVAPYLYLFDGSNFVIRRLE